MLAKQQIRLENWQPDPDRPGYLKFVDTPTIRAVFDQLHAALDTEGLIDEYFEPAIWEKLPVGDLPLARGVRFVSCWAVTGGSEGHYVHVELVYEDGIRKALALGKTFAGWDAAWTMAKRCAELLGA